jgi:outer membrane receptor protein involved in Fe transport
LLLLCLLLSLGALLGAANILQAQERTGTITGQLKDASGGVLPGATVVITNKTTARVTTLTTDGSGVYRADLDPGTYSVRYEMSGFARQEMPDVEVQLGKTYTINASMKVGNLSEAVQVTAETAPLIDMRSTTVARSVTSEQFDRMPKTRSFQGLATSLPSVNSGEIEGGYQVNGASGAENAFLVDGVMTNSLLYGSSRQNTVFEYLQEVQVKTTGIPAEYGGALGGVISAVTKSGGNSLHGEGHYYFDGSKLSAGPVKRLVLDPTDDKTVTFVQDAKQPDNHNEIGGSIGGPIVKDRLFYFGSVSPRFNRRTNTYKFSSGTETGSIKRTQTPNQMFGKVTYAKGRLTANGSLLYTPTKDTGTLPTYDGSAPNVLSSSLASNRSNLQRGYKNTQTNTSDSIDIALSNSSLVTVRGGYFYDNYADTGIPLTTSYTYQTSSIGLANVPANLQGPIGTQNTPRAQISFFDKTKRGFINADYNQSFNAAGLHALKGGFGFQRTINDVNTAYPGGFVYIYWNRAFKSNATGVTDTGTYGYYEVDNRGTQGVAGANIVSLYAQDEWTVSNRLTLNLGLRTEHEVVPSFRTDLKTNAFQFGFGDKLAPRLGAAYDVRGDGKMKVYGSWGLYYDWTKYELSRGSFGGDVWKIYYRSLDSLDLASINLSNKPGRDIWNPAVPNSARDRRVPNFNTVVPGIKPMSQASSSVGMDFQIDARTVFGTHYVHNQLIRTIEDLGAVVNGDEVYYIANPGEGAATITPPSGATAPFRTPKPIRKYDALEFTLNRRFASNWFLSGSYVYSRLYGNYAGLANSDEIRTPTTGVSAGTAQQQAGSIARPGTAVSRAWDIDELLWDARGHLDVVGRLATDRPHVGKVYGAYTFPSGTNVGLNLYVGSGTPITTGVNTINQTEVFVDGRGNLGRTPVLTLANLVASHEIKMASDRRLRVEFQVLNVFNQKATRHIFNDLNRGAGVARQSSAIDLAPIDLAKGYNYNALILASPDGINAYDPRYKRADLFSDGAQGQLVLKFIF